MSHNSNNNANVNASLGGGTTVGASGNYCLEWIGTGAGFNAALGNTSAILYDRRNPARAILLDCGYSITPALLASGKLKNIVAIIITHLHSDHVGGLESLGQMSFFAFKNQTPETKPTLCCHDREFVSSLWNSLSGGMSRYIDDSGCPCSATIDTYFNLVVGPRVHIPGFPEIELFEQQHVPGMPNFGIRIRTQSPNKLIYYSGDTTSPPPPQDLADSTFVFQDCHFGPVSPSDVHLAYKTLLATISTEHRHKVYLVHVGSGYKGVDVTADGLAGIVMPQTTFFF
ncbi:Ribonuclease BN [Pelomyxa schiedti]|nr:Ribonuclease BN [Pelomyxa schiedti]